MRWTSHHTTEWSVLTSLAHFFTTATQCTRLAPPDIKHQEVRAPLPWAFRSTTYNLHSSQATCLEWSWGLAPLTLTSTHLLTSSYVCSCAPLVSFPTHILLVTANLCKSFHANAWTLLPTRSTVQSLLEFSKTYVENRTDVPPPIIEVTLLS